MQNKTKDEFKYDFYQNIEEAKPETKEKSKSPEPKKKINPFDDLFDEPKEEIKEAPVVDNKPKKLKPFTIKPPPPPAQSKPIGVFQAPEIQASKTTISTDLFENPSKVTKPTQPSNNLPCFPEVENPFKTGNLISNPPPPQHPTNKYYTGYQNNYYK